MTDEPGAAGAASDAPPAASPPDNQPPAPRRRRVPRRLGIAALAVIGCLVLLLGSAMVVLTVAGSGTPSPAAHGTGHDAEWLGHAWVDGRKTQADVDALAAQVRGTGIHDLFVHAGPFSDDGTVDPGLRPRARWLTGALHAALPGVRVQAWLGAHPVPAHLHLDSPATRAAMLTAVGQVLDDGFDGVHYDLEPVADGVSDLLTLLRDTHALTRQRHAVLSISAIHNEPLPGMAAVAVALPGHRMIDWARGGVTGGWTSIPTGSRTRSAWSDPVAAYWPEFAQRGKEAITVRHVLQHRAGVPVARGTLRDALTMTDWGRAVRAVERAEPRWPAGQVPAYHIISYGVILGELARRVGGAPVPDLLARDLLDPLGLRDIHLGPPDRSGPGPRRGPADGRRSSPLTFGAVEPVSPGREIRLPPIDGGTSTRPCCRVPNVTPALASVTG